jgi:hypothetical protein
MATLLAALKPPYQDLSRRPAGQALAGTRGAFQHARARSASKGWPMLFMVIERFRDRDAKAVYRRFRERGRGAPEGLRYVDSWVEANFDRCFQVMECDDARLLQEWVAFWGDLVEFEIVPVVSSAETRATVERLLEAGRDGRST